MKAVLVRTDVERFIAAVQKGIDGFIEAGAIAAKADTGFVDAVCDANPDFTPDFVQRFVEVGLRRLHPRLLIAEGPGPRRLRKLDYATQEKYVKDPLPLVLADGKILHIDVRNLQPIQADQIFNGDHIRSEGEQRAWQEERKLKQPTKKAQADYKINRSKGTVVINGIEFSRRKLAQILAELE